MASGRRHRCADRAGRSRPATSPSAGVAVGSGRAGSRPSTTECRRAPRVAVVGRDLGAQHPAWSVADALRAAGRDVIVVECGWPRDDGRARTRSGRSAAPAVVARRWSTRARTVGRRREARHRHRRHQDGRGRARRRTATSAAGHARPSGFGARRRSSPRRAHVARMRDAHGGRRRRVRVGRHRHPRRRRPRHRRVAHAVNLGLEDLDLGGGLGAGSASTCAVENDVKAAALGAHHLLRLGDRRRTLAYLNLGTGLAAGLVLDGACWPRRSTAWPARSATCPSTRRARSCPLRPARLPRDASPRARRSRGCGRPTAPLPGADALRRGRRGRRRRAVAVRDAVPRRASPPAVRLLVLTPTSTTVVIGGGLSRARRAAARPGRAESARRAADSPFLASCSTVCVPADVPVDPRRGHSRRPRCGGRPSAGGRQRHGGRDPSQSDEVAAGDSSPTPSSRSSASSRTPCSAWRPGRPRSRSTARLAAHPATATSCADVRGFALDEYVGLPAGHPRATAR